MENNILVKIFVDVYHNLNYEREHGLFIPDPEALEKVLEDYLILVMGPTIKGNYANHYPEIRKYFENIFNNDNYDFQLDIIAVIKKYGEDFKAKISNHYYTNILIKALKRLYSENYDGKISFYEPENDSLDTMISHLDNSFIIGRMPRKGIINLPYVYIKNIDNLEKILKEFVETVIKSDSYYNIFANKYMQDIPEEMKIRALFEAVMFNATPEDLTIAEKFFMKEKAFIANDTMKDLQTLGYVGKALGDELYVMLKRSELEYETPYCLCFMLKNQVVELPIVRLGIDDKGKAHILAVQSSQSNLINLENRAKLEEGFKKIIPSNSKFRYFNPAHLVSIFMSFGILKGLGVTDVDVVDYLPFRFLKTTLDKQMSEEESDRYQQRLTDKNIYTFMRLASVVSGIRITSYPELNNKLMLNIEEDLFCGNVQLQELYEMCYEYAKNLKVENTRA